MGKKLRIALLGYRSNPYSGGQGIYLKHLAEGLAARGHEVHVITGPPYPEKMKDVILHPIHNSEYYVKKGRDVVSRPNLFKIFKPLDFLEWLHSRIGGFPEIWSFGFRAWWYLRKLHKEMPFDIIHDNQSLGYGLLLMKTLGLPVVATLHHPLTVDMRQEISRLAVFKKKAKTVLFYPVRMQSFVAKKLDHIITVSGNAGKMAIKDFGVSPKRITVVYNGIDREMFSPMRGVPRQKGSLLFVGNVEDPKKGFHWLLKALSILPEEITVTAVNGASPHRKSTDYLVSHFGLEGRVVFTGKISTEEVVEQYARAEIAVVPSVYEGFGFPAGEAMACGVPVISSTGGALPEVVGDAGISVAAHDYTALANAVMRLHNDESLRNEMSRNGIQRVAELFNWQRAVEEVEAVYRKFLNF